MDYGLSQRVALVTGCTSILGSNIARVLGKHGAWIALNYFADNQAAKRLLDTIRSEGGRSMLAAGSLRDSEGAWKVTRYIEAEWAQIDILVHVAGLLSGAEAVSDPQPILYELLPGMKARQWGRVVIFRRGAEDEIVTDNCGDNVMISYIQMTDKAWHEALILPLVTE